MPETHYYVIPKTGELARAASLDEARDMARNGGFVWLDFHQPTMDDLNPLIARLGLHPLSIEDCLDENQIPKIEDFPTNTFIIFNALQYAQSNLSIAEINLFIGADFLVTVSGHEIPIDGRAADHFEPLRNIERNVSLHIDGVRDGPAFLMHVILDTIVDRKVQAVETLEDELNDVEERMLSNLAGFDAGMLLHLRRTLLNVRKSLFHEREILMKICRKDCPFISEQAIFHYRDIYDHLAKFFELTETYRDTVTSLTEMYLTLLNNEMSRAANETNSIVRRLTVITTIFMPLTLLAGIGGMSEWSMMTGPENWRISYPLFLLGMLVIGIANYFILKWMEKRRRRRTLTGID